MRTSTESPPARRIVSARIRRRSNVSICLIFMRRRIELIRATVLSPDMGRTQYSTQMQRFVGVQKDIYFVAGRWPDIFIRRSSFVFSEAMTD